MAVCCGVGVGGDVLLFLNQSRKDGECSHRMVGLWRAEKEDPRSADNVGWLTMLPLEVLLASHLLQLQLRWLRLRAKAD